MQIIHLDTSWCKGKKPLFKVPEGCWLAGGCCRRWYTGEPQNSDYDYYTTDEQAAQRLIEELNLNNRVFTSATADTYDVAGQKVQVMKIYRKNIEDTFRHFDYRHCQFAYDGKDFYTTPEALICAERKHLSVNTVLPEFAMDTLRRAFKYHKQGYIPCAGTLQDLAIALKDKDVDVKNQIEQSPSGGKRIIRYD